MSGSNMSMCALRPTQRQADATNKDAPHRLAGAFLRLKMLVRNYVRTYLSAPPKGPAPLYWLLKRC